MKKAFYLAVFTACLVALALALTPTSTFAATRSTSDAAHHSHTRTGVVYVVHGIPGVPVDVYVNSKLALPNFQPGTVAGPVSLPAVRLVVTIYAAGANPATTQPVITAAATPSPYYPTSLVAHLTANGTPTLSVFREFPYSFPGFGQLHLRHDAALGPVDIYVRLFGQFIKLASGLTNGQSANFFLPAGSYFVAVTPAGASPNAAPLQGFFQVRSGKDLIVYAVGSPANGTLGVVEETLSTSW